MLFWIVGTGYIFLTYIADTKIFTDHFFYRSYSDQLPLYSIEAMLDLRERLWWTGYLVQPVMVLFKVSFLILCVSIAAILGDVELKISSIFKTGVLSESIFLIAQSLFLASLYLNSELITVETTSNYFPLSLLGFWGTENVVPWLHYPLRTLNLFEVFYILFISWLLSKQWKPNFIESLNIVLPSYGTGLLLWLVLVTFLTLQIS